MAIKLEDAKRCIEEIARGNRNLKKRLEKDVVAVCELISVFEDGCQARIKDKARLKDVLRKHFGAIYWSLKLHVFFHLGAEAAKDMKELQELGRMQGLTDEELDTLPDGTSWHESAADPGSTLLEFVSMHFRTFRGVL